MSGYNMKCFATDFADRTKTNYEIVKKSRDNHYEVTQLINSLLGLIVIPTEAFYDEIIADIISKSKKVEMFRKYNDQIKKIDNIICESIENKKYYNDYSEEENAITVIKHIRNSIAHGGNEGLMFYPINEMESGENKIKSIIFYDNNKYISKFNNVEHSYEFYIELTIGQLKKLVVSISNLFEEVEKDYGDDNTNRIVNSFQKKLEEKHNSIYQCYNEIIIGHNKQQKQ